EQHGRDVRKLLTMKDVAADLHRIDPVAFDALLTPWLQRSVNQMVESPIAGDGGLSRFFTVLRARAWMAAMFANVTNTLQQITGFSVAAVKVKPRHLVGAMAQWVRNPKAMTRAVVEASPYMESRMANETGMMIDQINDILLDPSVYQSAKAWTNRH